MSPLTRFRITIIVPIIGVVALLGVPEFSRTWVFVFLFSVAIGLAVIIGGTIQDNWDRMKARDLFHHIERE